MASAGKSSRTVGRRRAPLAVCAMAIAIAALEVPAAAEPFIAGVEPDKRPAAAPRSTTPAPLPPAAQTVGIATPLPPLSFIKDHGGWYTPFTRPGMPGPYDIRGLHTTGAKASAPRAAASADAAKKP